MYNNVYNSTSPTLLFALPFSLAFSPSLFFTLSIPYLITQQFLCSLYILITYKQNLKKKKNKTGRAPSNISSRTFCSRLNALDHFFLHQEHSMSAHYDQDQIYRKSAAVLAIGQAVTSPDISQKILTLITGSQHMCYTPLYKDGMHCE